MTNTQIIFNESIRLMEDGIIKGSGIWGQIETADGIKEIEFPEEIHTFAAWKERGRQVKKGQHARAAFTIWKHASKKVADEDGNEEERGRMFMKKAFWFTFDQTEPLKARA